MGDNAPTVAGSTGPAEATGQQPLFFVPFFISPMVIHVLNAGANGSPEPVSTTTSTSTPSEPLPPSANLNTPQEGAASPQTFFTFFIPFNFIPATDASPHLQGQPPASAKSISHLRSRGPETVAPSTLCAICQDDMSISDPSTQEVAGTLQLLEMPCTHTFHRACLTSWLQKSNTCPTCRWEVETENEEYNVGVRERMRSRKIPLASLRCALQAIGCCSGGDAVTMGMSGCECAFHEDCLTTGLRVGGWEGRWGRCPACRREGGMLSLGPKEQGANSVSASVGAEKVADAA